MTTDQMVERVRTLLNREDDDDLFEYPGEYYGALSYANRKAVEKLVTHAPELVYETTTVSSLDSGATYVLTDDHLGRLLLFTPPGPVGGTLLIPSLPEGRGDYWQDGRTITMVVTRLYSPLHVMWIPATISALDADTDSGLPVYMHDWICFRAAGDLARKPGFLGDPNSFEIRAVHEWVGRPDDVSDEGILGIISKQRENQGYESATDVSMPWYKRLT